MNPENPIEDINKTPRDIFREALEEELSKMVDSREMTQEEADVKKENASLIEDGFSNNPKEDAHLFSIAEWLPEEKLIDHFKKGKKNKK